MSNTPPRVLITTDAETLVRHLIDRHGPEGPGLIVRSRVFSDEGAALFERLAPPPRDG